MNEFEKAGRRIRELEPRVGSMIWTFMYHERDNGSLCEEPGGRFQLAIFTPGRCATIMEVDPLPAQQETYR